MTKTEAESVIRFDETADGAYLWTASQVQMRRWQKARIAVVAEGHGWRARVDKGWIRVRPPRRGNAGGFQKRGQS